MKKLAAVFLSTFLLTSCVTSQYDDRQPLSANEGLVLVKCKDTSFLPKLIALYEPNFETGLLPDNNVPGIRRTSEGKLSIIKVKAGLYYLDRVARYLSETERLAAEKFTVQPNKVNYIGDLEVFTGDGGAHRDGPLTTYQTYRKVMVSDNVNMTRQEFMRSMPDVARKYPLVSSIAR